MQIKFRRSVLFAVVPLLLGAPTAVLAADDDEALEEVIVTGSYIRRDNFDIPSPMDVTTELDLEMAGTSDLGDVIFDQSFQFGVNANATPFEGNAADDQQWNQGQEVWANLRGLGTRATMTMIDGHRLPADTNTWGRRAGVDVNATYPQIAIGRIETILDGASALYGAEAVGGVINLIPKKDFDGIELAYEIQQPLEDGAPTEVKSLLAGVQGDRGSAIFAVEVRKQERMRFTDRPRFIPTAADPWAGQTMTPWWHDRGDGGSPSTYVVPIRDANGNLMPVDGSNGYTSAPWTRWTDHPVGHAATGAVQRVTRADPGCGYGFGGGHDEDINGRDDLRFGTPMNWGEDQIPDAFKSGEVDRTQNGASAYTDLNKHGNFLNGMLHAHSNLWRGPECIMSLSDLQDMQAEADLRKGMAYFEYDFTDYIRLRGELVITQNDYNTRDVTSEIDEIDGNEVNGPLSPVVIGHNPGNPFRAFADGSTYDPTGAGVFAGTVNGRLDWDDQNGNNLYDYGVEPGEYYLFAPDTDGDGRPDRDYDGDGVAEGGLAQGDPEAMVVLFGLGDTDGDGVADRFDEDWALANGGVRLFEDVRIIGWAATVHPKNPRNNTLRWTMNDNGILGYKRRFIRNNIRFRTGAEISIPNTDWIVDVDWVWAQGNRETTYPEPEQNAYVKALRCQGGRDTNDLETGVSHGGSGTCFNPFSTSYLNSTADGQLIGDQSIKFPADDDPGWRPFFWDSNGDGVIDPELDQVSPEVNTQLENRQAGIIFMYNTQVLTMQLVDVIASTGSLFELPWNDTPVGFAIGVHWREEGEEWKPNAANQTNYGGGARDLRKSQQVTNAVFAELQFQLIDSPRWGAMELQLAARYSEIETTGSIGLQGKSKFDTTIPKVAVRYSPTDWLAIRASLTEGFVTPGLYALFGTPGQYSGPGTAGADQRTVGDYLCDNVPEIPDCEGVSPGSGVPNVLAAGAPNRDLGAETSDLWNAGFSLRLLDGDLVLDFDYTEVEFKGRTEQIGAAVNVRSNEPGFEDYLLAACPGTVPDWDNSTNEALPATFIADHDTNGDGVVDVDEYIAQTPQSELDCRLNAALNWVTTDANGGLGERALGGSVIRRGDGPNGLRLTYAEEPWLQQGVQTTRTMIYGAQYSFDATQIPLIGGDWGSFTAHLSATQMLEQSIMRYTSIGCDAALMAADGSCPGDHPHAGIEVDGVGNRNADNYGFNSPGDALFAPLPPTPEWRVNAGLRWFYNNHTLQLTGNWHDSVTNYNIAWDELRERGLLSASQAEIAEVDRCNRQPSCVGSYDSEAYWHLSYSYNKPDIFQGINLNLNVAIRNVFDNYPEPRTMPTGFEGYLDNIYGRIGFVRITLGM